jgi:hypothetical protein
MHAREVSTNFSLVRRITQKSQAHTEDNIKKELKSAMVWTEFKWLKITFRSVNFVKNKPEIINAQKVNKIELN